jgi:hypothetical protein
MSSVNNKVDNNPLNALGRLFGAGKSELGRAGNEGLQRTTEDIDSVGKALETGGFIGGALQFLDVTSLGHQVANVADVATGAGTLDPKLKEGISAATNWAVGSPALFKDLFDLFTAPSTPGVRPSAPNSVPPPNVEQLRGPNAPSAPSAPNAPGRTGYADDVVGSTRTYEVHIVESRGAHQKLVELTGTLEELRNNPEVAKKYPEVKYALDQKDWSLSAQTTMIVMTALKESPETRDAITDLAAREHIQVIPPNFAVNDGKVLAPGINDPAVQPSPPAGSTGQGDFSQAGDQLGQLAQGAMGMLGQAFSFIGPLLSNPAVVALLTPLIGAALTALATVFPPAALLIPLVPVILPLIGTGMTMAGGMMTGQGGGAAPDLGALLGAGPSAGGVGDLLGPIAGLLGGGGSPLPLPA